MNISLLYILYISLGMLAPILSQHIAEKFTISRPINKKNPQEILGTFYKGQALKLALFTIITLITLIFAQQKSSIVIVGVITGTILQKLGLIQRKNHEPHIPYSN